YTDILHNASAATSGFQTNPSVCTIKDTIADGHFLHSPTHLAADNHTTVSAQHGAIGNGDILARNTQFTRLQVTSGFDGDAVIAYRNVAVADVYILTRLGVDAVRVGGRHIVDGNAFNGHIVAKFRIYSPE